MASTLANAVQASQVRRTDMPRRMAKARIRKTDIGSFMPKIGAAIERTRTLAKLNLQEFSAAIKRDERQVARWIAGEERPHLDAIFAVDGLGEKLVIALAELAQCGGAVEVETTIKVRRSA